MGPVAQSFDEWASTSHTFSIIAVLIAVVQKEVDKLCLFTSPPPACLPAEIFFVYCSYVLAVRASPPEVEMARLVVLRYGGEWA